MQWLKISFQSFKINWKVIDSHIGLFTYFFFAGMIQLFLPQDNRGILQKNIDRHVASLSDNF